MMFKRIILLVLDGCGCGIQKDYRKYHAKKTNTLGNLYRGEPKFHLPFLESLGLSQLLGVGKSNPGATYAVLTERSPGNDTFAGMWEMLGTPLTRRFSTGRRGLGSELLRELRRHTNITTLCNRFIAGNKVLDLYYRQHMSSGRPILYFSDDGVILLAAHYKVIRPNELNKLAERLAGALFNKGYIRIITRPFIGGPKKFTRLEEFRKDFMLTPLVPLDLFGHMHDKHVGARITEHLNHILGLKHASVLQGSHKNRELMALIKRDVKRRRERFFSYILQDTDNIGHRKDPSAFRSALYDVDTWLARELAPRLGEHDLLLITADHGCDPTVRMRGHCREHVPLLAYSPLGIKPGFLGHRLTFADIGQTIAYNFGLPKLRHGTVLPIKPR